MLRWRHPQKGLLAPAAFLGLLEETGDIVTVGRTLLKTACHQTAQWRAAGHPQLIVAVNLSSEEFWHAGLVDAVREALTESGLPPHALQLELTEGIFMENVEAALARILALKSVGVTVAVDDFGTGYSSLAHLKRFQLDVLKIDRYFVRDIETNPANEALLGSILALCRGLGLGTVTEGIENPAQLDVLKRLDCTVVQGYYISKPLPAEALGALLRRDGFNAFSGQPPSALA